MEVSEELARVHAHLCGDGTVCKYKTKRKDRNFIAITGYYNKNQKLLEKFREDFSKIFHVKMKMRINRDVSISSIRIYNELISRFGSFGSKNWRISEKIKKSNEKIKIEWLKAFFEDEAYHEKEYNRLKIKSMNFCGLKDVGDMLNSIKISSNLTGPNCDKSYYLTIPNFNEIDKFNNFVKIPIRKGHNNI